jgi:NTE family protein
MNNVLSAFLTSLFCVALLSACSTVAPYQKEKTITSIDFNSGYRPKTSIEKENYDNNLIIVMFSGGGSRAAALGYGVLEELSNTYITVNSQKKSIADNIDLVFGVSGGSILAAYFSLHGPDTVPSFDKNFLQRDFQNQLIDKFLSISNWPKLMSDQYGRGDLLQEELNNTLFYHAKFKDLEHNRKGPYAIISATDMSIGQKILFTQDFFDMLCIDIGETEIARAVASSSSVPLIFAPITYNNNAGNCGFSFDDLMSRKLSNKTLNTNSLKSKNINDAREIFNLYQDSKARPYIHLVDGGLTDNLGLSTILDPYDISNFDSMYEKARTEGFKNIIIINVNAQNKIKSNIDSTANIPDSFEAINTIINVPIDIYSANSIKRFRQFVDEWEEFSKDKEDKIEFKFVSIALKDIKDQTLRDEVLNISTSFFIPKKDVLKLKRAATILLENSDEYKDVIKLLKATKEYKYISDYN